LRVPKPLGDRLILRALRESAGTAVAVSDQDIIDMTQRLVRTEGLSMAYEGAATIVAAQQLLDRGWIKSDEQVLCLNTGAGWKNQAGG
jgi:threonine synthase